MAQMSTSYDTHRCWAYSRTGKRCDLDAAHDGLHSTTFAWDEDECYDPAGMILVPVLDVPYLDEQPKDAPGAAQEPRTAPQRYCVVCEHPGPHEKGQCGGRGVVPGTPCDCATFVG
jgi:hypothetical protein